MIDATVEMVIDEFNYRLALAMPSTTVIFHKPIFEDGYLDIGMKAKLVGVRPDVSYVGEETGEQMWLLEFDFSEFVEFNKQRETSDYYDSHGNPTLTATEAGYVPKNRREEFYVMRTDDTYYFSILDESEENVIYFESKEERDMAVRGLMDLDALFEMRVNEAGSAGDAHHAVIAQKERDVVAKALKAFGVDI